MPQGAGATRDGAAHARARHRQLLTSSVLRVAHRGDGAAHALPPAALGLQPSEDALGVVVPLHAFASTHILRACCVHACTCLFRCVCFLEFPVEGPPPGTGDFLPSRGRGHPPGRSPWPSGRHQSCSANLHDARCAAHTLHYELCMCNALTGTDRLWENPAVRGGGAACEAAAWPCRARAARPCCRCTP